MRHRAVIALLATGLLTSVTIVAFAQPGPEEPARSAPPILANADDDLPPISPKTSSGPMSLDACIDLGFQHQPALAGDQDRRNFK